MIKAISTHIESVNEEVYLAALYNETVNGQPITCCHIIKPYKMAIFFDEFGDRKVEYYTKEEWYGIEDYAEYYRKENLKYKPVLLNHPLFLMYLNSFLCHSDLKSLADEIMHYQHVINYERLPSQSKELLSRIMDWDNSKPFYLPGLFDVTQHKIEPDDGNDVYDVDCFNL